MRSRTFLVLIAAVCLALMPIGSDATLRRRVVQTDSTGRSGNSQPMPFAPTGQATTIAYSVASDLNDMLYTIDLATGVATPIGAVGFSDVEGLAFDANGVLYGVDDITDQLITIDTATGAGTVVGALGVSITDMGLTFDASGNLWMSTDAPSPETFYSLNPATGAATAVGGQGQDVTGLTNLGDTIYGIGGDNTDNLVTMNTATGAATSVGPLGTVTLGDGGLEFDGLGTLWGINDNGPASQIFTINPATGAATLVTTARDMSNNPLTGFESLAIFAADGPITVCDSAAGLFGFCAVDDASGDTFQMVVDPTSSSYGVWQYTVVATNTVICGQANYTSYTAGARLRAYDNDYSAENPIYFMDANFGGRSGTVVVRHVNGSVRLTLRDRNLLNSNCAPVD